MLSICIPIFNFNASELIHELHKQMLACDEKTELIIIDDASSLVYKEKIKEVIGSHTYLELTENIGRAKIRNLFLKYIQYDYLLFLDGDSLIIHPDFIKRYIQCIKQNEVAIVCGGRIYPTHCPSRKQALSWKYGTFKESKSVFERNQYPNRSFMTNNFLIQKKIFIQFPFNELLINYGHEDTLFGYQLSKDHISIVHIDNPILNGDIEMNNIFIDKTEKGIQNLIFICQSLQQDNSFIENISLLKTQSFIKSIHLSIFFRILFFFLQAPIRKVLESGFAPILLFNFYKLSYLIKIDRD
ncbi:MAG: glycosyltransferase [Bacteroidota bacterium]